MVLYVLDAAAQEDVRATVVVVGHGATWVEKSLTERARADVNLMFVEQSEQLGTGHAVSVALPTIDDELGASDGDVLILPGDTPLLRPGTVARLLDVHRESQAALTVLTAEVDDPSGYGRIVHAKNGAIARIVEERDASPDERLITEINTSIMVVRASLLGPALRRVGRQNAKHEYYLTDLIAVLARGRPRHPGAVVGGLQRSGRRERPGPAGPGRVGIARPDQREVAAPRRGDLESRSTPTSTPTSSWPRRSHSSRARCSRVTALSSAVRASVRTPS